MDPQDDELKKAFSEMHVNKASTNKTLYLLNSKCNIAKIEKKQYELTRIGTSDIDDDGSVYTSVGRMFVSSTMGSVRSDLKTKIEKCDENIQVLNNKIDALKKSMQDQEDALRELVNSRKVGDSAANQDKP